MVGIGGFFGAIARLSISNQLNKKFKTKLPLGTLTVNLSGAFLLGILLGAKVDVMVILLLGTGFLGAFTTFSTLKLEMVQMHLKKYNKEFFLYLFTTYGIGLLLAYLGFWIGGYLQ
ncbi:fluoride efflux transporter CrcB [Neobacillus sp. FSL H8-0543]|uniref:fluoride efflux transporter CrcB n=1 Tax=Neobacillus sp. FSL H8-0543 TaxID=2954672 RepID=UPI0031583DF1